MKKLEPTNSIQYSEFFNRDLSWLQFNNRVLAEAQDPTNPLLERLKFLGIASSNLDEFFMVRVATLDSESADPSQLLQAVSKSLTQQNKVLHYLSKELQKEGVDIVYRIKSRPEYLSIARDVFIDSILSELGYPRHFNPELLLEVRNLQIACLFPDSSMYLTPRTLPLVYWRRVGKNKIVSFFLDDLISVFLSECYGIESEPLMFRVTRDADVQVELSIDDNESIPDLVRRQVRTREKRRVLRLQIRREPSSPDYTSIAKFYKLKEDQIFSSSSTICLNGVILLVSELAPILRDHKKLYYPKFTPCIPKPFDSPGAIFKQIEKRDYFFHQPYDSFEGYVNFIREAVGDPSVLSIEQTVYRVDALSEVTNLLCKAVRNGKIVKVYIETRARFDEINNIRLAEHLKKSGVQVVFARGKLKVHAKIALVTKNGPAGLVTYSHLSTGNYNAKTARQYTDMAIFTANADIGRDLRVFFDSIPTLQNPDKMKLLMTAPGELHRRILSLIKHEIVAASNGQKSYIFAKVNALVDPKVIRALYEASQAGVEIDLMVRGACTLVPGVPGLSSNIRVFSVVDRFLEHSRIYYFKSSKKIYLSSADWMPRNFFARLEVAFPVLDPRIVQFLEQIVIPTYLRDRVKARILRKNGSWVKLRGDKTTRSQLVFTKLANSEYRKTSLFFGEDTSRK